MLRTARLTGIFGIFILLQGSSAFAYCRRTTCETTPAPAGCVGSRDENNCSNEGLPLRWRSSCLSFSVNDGGSLTCRISSDALEQQVRAAFDSWAAAECASGGTPSLYVATYPQASCKEVGYQSDGPNQNLWVFRDGPWEYEANADGVLALTTLTVNPDTGEIYDADVELNSNDNLFTLSTESVVTNLQNVILHETGHVLGIGHSLGLASTMSSALESGSANIRTLTNDDAEAVCAIMPPGALPENCDTEPLGGFATSCCWTDSGCCAIGPKRPSSSAPAWVLSLLLITCVLRRRTRQAR